MGKEVFESSREDIFGHALFVSPYNQVEMRLDAADYTDFTDETTANGGTVSQSGGVVTVSTGTNATGSATLFSVDTLEYRPSIGLYAGGTAVFSAGAAGCNQYAGIATNANLDDAVMFGRKGGQFGILYRRGGSEIDFYPQGEWNVDTCIADSGTAFQLDGDEKTLDAAAYGGPYLIEAGLFGYAGWRASVWSPDNGWIIVHQYKNFSLNPIFTSNSFEIYITATKTSGSGDHTITGQCWAGGTGSQLERLGATLNDRRLVQNVRSVISGKTTAGGGGYVDVKVSPSGALAMEAEQDVHDNLNLNANLQVGDSDVSGTNPVPVKITEEAITAAVKAGQVYTAGGSAQTTTGAQNASLDIENPSGSGKNILVIGFLIQIDISGPLTAQFVEDPTITGGTTQNDLNHLFGGSGASAVVTTGVNIVSSGTTLTPRIFVKDVAPFLYEGAPFILPAGKNVSVQITGQTLTTINYQFNVTWIETDA